MNYFSPKNPKRWEKSLHLTDEKSGIQTIAAQGWDSNPALQTHLFIQQHHCVALLGSGNTMMGDQSWRLLHGAYGLVRKTGNKTFPRKVKKYLRQRKQGGVPEDSECQDREMWPSYRWGRCSRKPSLKVTLCWNLKRGEKKLWRHAVKTPVQVT